MQGNRVTRIRSDHPHHQAKPDPQQQGPAEDRARQGPPSPSPSSSAVEALPAATRADLRWGRQQPDQDRTATSQQSDAQDSGLREQLLAELEDLARELKMQVARHELLAEVQAAAPASEGAMLRRYETLGEIAATVLGIEITSGEEQLRRDWAAEQELAMKTFPTWKEGSAK